MSRPRRRTTVKKRVSVAHDDPTSHPKSLELESRIARLELLAKILRKASDDQTKMIASLKAEITHFIARLSVTQ